MTASATLPVSPADQFTAAFNAWIPFSLAVLVVGVAIWQFVRWAYAWRYDGTIEQLNAMLRLAAAENETAKDREQRLRETIDELTTKVRNLQSGGADTVPLVQDLSRLTLRADTQLTQLRTANSAIEEALKRGATITTMGAPYGFFWRGVPDSHENK